MVFRIILNFEYKGDIMGLRVSVLFKDFLQDGGPQAGLAPKKCCYGKVRIPALGHVRTINVIIVIVY
jgi:hypothetical protein